MLSNKSYIRSGRSLRMMRLLGIAVLCTVFSYTGKSYADGLSISTNGAKCDPLVDNTCCYDLVFNIDGATTLTDIHLMINDPTCGGGSAWDFPCFESTYGGGGTFNGTPWTFTKNAAGDYVITFNAAITGVAAFTLHICPYAGCGVVAGTNIFWEYKNGVNIIRSGTDYFQGCGGGGGGGVAPCPTCDWTTLYHWDVYDMANTKCYSRLCFKKRSGYVGGTVGKFVIHFDPAFCESSCMPPGYMDPPANNQPCSTATTIQLPGGWNRTNQYPAVGCIDSLEFDPGSDSTWACEEFCLLIPACNPETPRRIWITDNSDLGHHCIPKPIMPSKKGERPELEVHPTTESNYPNPLSKENQFTTIIPFELASDGGDAKVSIFDETGRLIYSEASTFAGSGKHFFYFTAKDIPAGSYYYSIESPLGIMIVKRSLLIVK